MLLLVVEFWILKCSCHVRIGDGPYDGILLNGGKVGNMQLMMGWYLYN